MNCKKTKRVCLILMMCCFSVSVYAERTQFTYDSKGKRDPFSYPVASEDATVVRDISLLNFEVNGIIWDENESYAIINDEIVKEGDIVKGVKVLEVKKYSVVFGTNNKKYEVNVKKEDKQ